MMYTSMLWAAVFVAFSAQSHASIPPSESGDPAAEVTLEARLRPVRQDRDPSEAHLALVLWIKKEGKSEVCSGVAIDRQVVLTAAHCLDGAKSVRVAYGPEPAERPDLVIRGERWSIHPKYNRSQSYFLHDLGVLELAKPLPEEVPVASLATTGDRVDPGTRLERVGFGRRNGVIRRTWIDPEFRGTVSNLAIISHDLNAVPGDSGGPIFARIDGKLRLVGVHSTLQRNGRAMGVSVIPVLEEWIALKALDGALAQSIAALAQPSVQSANHDAQRAPAATVTQ